MAEAKSSMAENDGSFGDSPEQKSLVFRNKWRSAFKTIKSRGFSVLRSASSDRDPENLEKSGDFKSKGRLSKQKSEANAEEEVDPVYLLLKQATSMYPKSPSSRKNSFQAGASVDSGLGSCVQLEGAGDSDPSFSRAKNEEREDSVSAKLPAQTKKKPPKLNTKMKSSSLDCGDSLPPSLLPARHKKSQGDSSPNLQKVKLGIPKAQKTHSFDISEGRSSTSCSPCPSPFWSNQSLASACSVVTHEYRAKFPEELDLRLGERLVLTDTSDPDWSHGFKASDSNLSTGIFPSPCTAKIQSNERVLQVVQNINLCNGTKSLRLYRDQIIFAQGEVNDDGMIMIRTERNYKALCPVQYLMFLE